MKKSFVLLTVLLTIGFVSVTYGQPNPADPDLRFWLAADQLAATHVNNQPVTTMTSMDSYATIMAPDLVGTGPGQTTSGPHIDLPPYYQVTGSGHSVLYFHRDGSAWDDNSSSRMWQMNNLGAGDPTDIGAGTALTVYAVYQNIGANRGDGPVDVGPWNPVVVKRGTGSCVWQYGDNAADDLSGASPVHVTYDAITIYPAGDPKHQWSDWNLGKMSIDAAPDGFVNFWSDNGLTAGGTGMVAHANNGILQQVARNPTTPEPMGIATHSQDCCGHGETFAGAIAEIIIYANELDPAEAADIEAYLTQKYAGITPIPEPMTLSLLGLGGLALLRRKRS
jgi:hypothetical protein